MGLPLIKGRTFTDQDAATTSRASIIISESAARRSWQSPGDPVGASATIKPYGFPIFTIIGVVGDTRDWFSGEPAPTVYVLNDQMPQWGMQLIARTIGDPAKALGMIKAQAQGGDRTEPIYDAKTMDQLFDEELSGVRLSAWMMGVFAVIALVLASSGVYGVVSYSVACRTREIGIRMALGADPTDVRRQVVMHALQLAAVGIAIGTAAALALTRVMSSVLYEVVALEAGTFVGVGLLLAGSAFIAGYIPARRASSVDPLAALRDE
jgi:putative ABC transport system permease protein